MATESKKENRQLIERVQAGQRDFPIFFFQCLIIIQRLLWAELSLPQIRMFKF